ncbi:hypothetical protein POJ06DRAFT_261323 [Lipomyces tetrasporus]|uniref:Uncharacterized protein n=1 Tax=Lipomyces tetrasporus TaxID=54092 RepID=A0AAD7QLZ8_9ASCO|nr:uncharacterized protein POJ06DRAFT_261323 [Lipomyces tetrasporus]KAJ8097425.1 hypothetical protein POJ06DRAFT_261323 [Lipomyces tetrasporus]
MAKLAPEPDFAALVLDLFHNLPSPQPAASTPSLFFLDLLSPFLRSRFTAPGTTTCQRPPYYWSSLLTISANTNVSLAVAKALHCVDPAFAYMVASINGVKRVDERTLLASALLPVGMCTECARSPTDTPDESELELIWIYVDFPGRRGWKLHEAKMAVMDELCYWREWSATVEDAERVWGDEIAARREKEQIKAALLQHQAAAASLAHTSTGLSACAARTQSLFMSGTEMQFREAAAAAVPVAQPVKPDVNDFARARDSTTKAEETRQELCDVSFDDDDDDYWNRYDNSGSIITPSPELVQSLKTIRRLEELSANSDDNSCSSPRSLPTIASSLQQQSQPYLRPPSAGSKRPAPEPQYSRPASSMSTASTASSGSQKSTISFLPLLPTDNDDYGSKRAVEQHVRHAMSGFFGVAKENGISPKGFGELVNESLQASTGTAVY